MSKKRIIQQASIFLLFFVIVLLYLSPLALMVINSFKDYSQIMSDVVSLPKKITFENFQNVFTQMDFPKTFMNTVTTTAIGVFGIVILGATAGYKLSRTTTRLSFVLFLICIFPMMIPFQSFMITLVKVAKILHLTGSVEGLGVIYWGLGAPMAIFLFHGFVKGIPLELEECALLDGCNPYTTFGYIVFPLLKPVTASVIVVNVMWLWNDFLLPLLVLGSSKTEKTLQLAAYGFIGQYKMQWQNIMAGAIMIIIPALVIYLIFQKQIIKGMVAGAVKG